MLMSHDAMNRNCEDEMTWNTTNETVGPKLLRKGRLKDAAQFHQILLRKAKSTRVHILRQHCDVMFRVFKWH